MRGQHAAAEREQLDALEHRIATLENQIAGEYSGLRAEGVDPATARAAIRGSNELLLNLRRQRDDLRRLRGKNLATVGLASRLRALCEQARSRPHRRGRRTSTTTHGAAGRTRRGRGLDTVRHVRRERPHRDRERGPAAGQHGRRVPELSENPSHTRAARHWRDPGASPRCSRRRRRRAGTASRTGRCSHPVRGRRSHCVERGHSDPSDRVGLAESIAEPHHRHHQVNEMFAPNRMVGHRMVGHTDAGLAMIRPLESCHERGATGPTGDPPELGKS